MMMVEVVLTLCLILLLDWSKVGGKRNSSDEDEDTGSSSSSAPMQRARFVVVVSLCVFSTRKSSINLSVVFSETLPKMIFEFEISYRKFGVFR